MNARGEARLWVMQRATALVLALCVAVHLVTIIYAVRGGLSASEILGRTRGNVAWASFYGVFVLAASIHGSIGLRNIAMEWGGLRSRPAHVLMAIAAALLAALGLRAVFAVVSA